MRGGVAGHRLTECKLYLTYKYVILNLHKEPESGNPLAPGSMNGHINVES